MAGSRKPSIWAAGGVVTRTRNGKPEYLVIYRKHYDDWSLPKGKLSRGDLRGAGHGASCCETTPQGQ